MPIAPSTTGSGQKRPPSAAPEAASPSPAKKARADEPPSKVSILLEAPYIPASGDTQVVSGLAPTNPLQRRDIVLSFDPTSVNRSSAIATTVFDATDSRIKPILLQGLYATSRLLPSLRVYQPWFTVDRARMIASLGAGGGLLEDTESYGRRLTYIARFETELADDLPFEASKLFQPRFVRTWAQVSTAKEKKKKKTTTTTTKSTERDLVPDPELRSLVTQHKVTANMSGVRPSADDHEARGADGAIVAPFASFMLEHTASATPVRLEVVASGVWARLKSLLDEGSYTLATKEPVDLPAIVDAIDTAFRQDGSENASSWNRADGAKAVVTTMIDETLQRMFESRRLQNMRHLIQEEAKQMSNTVDRATVILSALARGGLQPGEETNDELKAWFVDVLGRRKKEWKDKTSFDEYKADKDPAAWWGRLLADLADKRTDGPGVANVKARLEAFEEFFEDERYEAQHMRPPVVALAEQISAIAPLPPTTGDATKKPSDETLYDELRAVKYVLVLLSYDPAIRRPLSVGADVDDVALARNVAEISTRLTSAFDDFPCILQSPSADDLCIMTKTRTASLARLSAVMPLLTYASYYRRDVTGMDQTYLRSIPEEKDDASAKPAKPAKAPEAAESVAAAAPATQKPKPPKVTIYRGADAAKKAAEADDESAESSDDEDEEEEEEEEEEEDEANNPRIMENKLWALERRNYADALRAMVPSIDLATQLKRLPFLDAAADGSQASILASPFSTRLCTEFCHRVIGAMGVPTRDALNALLTAVVNRIEQMAASLRAYTPVDDAYVAANSPDDKFLAAAHVQAIKRQINGVPYDSGDAATTEATELEGFAITTDRHVTDCLLALGFYYVQAMIATTTTSRAWNLPALGHFLLCVSTAGLLHHRTGIPRKRWLFARPAVFRHRPDDCNVVPLSALANVRLATIAAPWRLVYEMERHAVAYLKAAMATDKQWRERAAQRGGPDYWSLATKGLAAAVHAFTMEQYLSTDPATDRYLVATLPDPDTDAEGATMVVRIDHAAFDRTEEGRYRDEFRRTYADYGTRDRQALPAWMQEALRPDEMLAFLLCTVPRMPDVDGVAAVDNKSRRLFLTAMNVLQGGVAFARMSVDLRLQFEAAAFDERHERLSGPRYMSILHSMGIFSGFVPDLMTTRERVSTYLRYPAGQQATTTDALVAAITHRLRYAPHKRAAAVAGAAATDRPPFETSDDPCVPFLVGLAYAMPRREVLLTLEHAQAVPFDAFAAQRLDKTPWGFAGVFYPGGDGSVASTLPRGLPLLETSRLVRETVFAKTVAARGFLRTYLDWCGPQPTELRLLRQQDRVGPVIAWIRANGNLGLTPAHMRATPDDRGSRFFDTRVDNSSSDTTTEDRYYKDKDDDDNDEGVEGLRVDEILDVLPEAPAPPSDVLPEQRGGAGGDGAFMYDSQRRPANAEALQELIKNLPRVGSGLEVKDSKIPDAGRGVFATRAFAEGEIVSFYEGAVLVQPDLEANYKRLNKQDSAVSDWSDKMGDPAWLSKRSPVPFEHATTARSFLEHAQRIVNSELLRAYRSHVHAGRNTSATYGRVMWLGRHPAYTDAGGRMHRPVLDSAPETVEGMGAGAFINQSNDAIGATRANVKYVPLQTDDHDDVPDDGGFDPRRQAILVVAMRAIAAGAELYVNYGRDPGTGGGGGVGGEGPIADGSEAAEQRNMLTILIDTLTDVSEDWQQKEIGDWIAAFRDYLLRPYGRLYARQYMTTAPDDEAAAVAVRAALKTMSDAVTERLSTVKSTSRLFANGWRRLSKPLAADEVIDPLPALGTVVMFVDQGTVPLLGAAKLRPEQRDTTIENTLTIMRYARLRMQTAVDWTADVQVLVDRTIARTLHLLFADDRKGLPKWWPRQGRGDDSIPVTDDLVTIRAALETQGLKHKEIAALLQKAKTLLAPKPS